MPTAFIQTLAGKLLNVNCFQAAEGFEHLGYLIRPFEEGECTTLPLERGNLVVGNPSVVHATLRRREIEIPRVEIPEALYPYLHRKLWVLPLGSVRTLHHGALFLSPRIAGLFPFHAVRSSTDLYRTAHLDDETLVYASEAVDLRAQFRTFVFRGKVLGLRPKWGDECAFPDPARIQACIRQDPDGAEAYALDFGVTATGETILLCRVDPLCMAGYGLPAVEYARMVQARWHGLDARNPGERIG